MNVLVQLQEIDWSYLVTDPAHPTFWTQKVASPTPLCPEGSCVADTVWYFPEGSTGSPTPCVNRIDWQVPVEGGFLTDARFRDVLLLAKRYALALMSAPPDGPLRLATIRHRLASLFKLCRFLAALTRAGRSGRLMDITAADATAFVGEVSKDWSSVSSCFANLRRTIIHLDHYGAAILGDQFRKVSPETMLGIIRSAANARQRVDVVGPIYSSPPMSDEYCNAMLDIGDFYNDRLADAIIENAGYLRELRSQELEDHGLGPQDDYWDPRRARLIFAEHAKTYPWPEAELPFEHAYTWPPRSTRDLETVLCVLQSANMQKVCFNTGARSGETLSMDKHCLSERTVDGVQADFVRTIRFKFAREPGGVPVEWRVSASVAKAIEIQIRLAEALGSPGIWCCIKLEKLGTRLTSSVAFQLRSFVRNHGLDHLVEGSIGLHRFRSTIARLIMLGRKGHPRLVKRVLGHRKMVTTIRYIEQSPWIAQELAYARRGRTAAVRSAAAQDSDFTNVHELEQDLDPVALEAMIAHFGRSGTGRLKLLAPGIFGYGEISEVEDFEDREVMLAALDYAIGHLADRSVLAVPSVRTWLSEEAGRLAAAPGVAERFAPVDPRRQAAFSLLMDRVERVR